MNFFKPDAVRLLCQQFNSEVELMDDRPIITDEKKREYLRKVAEVDSCAAADMIFDFFEHRNFIRKLKGCEGDSWQINSKFDDEWALNVFSEDIHSLATGVYKLDDILKGGFRLYCVNGGKSPNKSTEALSVVVQGRPGAGKTTMALSLMCNFAAQGYSSVYLSAEQGIGSLMRSVKRWCSNVAALESGQVFTCSLRNPPKSDALDEWQRLSDDERFAHHFENEELKKKCGLVKFSEPSREFFVAIAADKVQRGDEEYGQAAGVFPLHVRKEVQQLVKNGLQGVVISRIGFRAKFDSELVRGAFLDFGDRGGFVARMRQLFDLWEPLKFSWMVLDSASAIAQASKRGFVASANAEYPDLSKMYLTEEASLRENVPTDLETSCDMLVELGERPLQVDRVGESGSSYMQRVLEIKKFRNSPFHRGKHPMAIKSAGVKVYRSIAILLKVTGKIHRDGELGSRDIQSTVEAEFDNDSVLSFGVDGLNEALRRSATMGSLSLLQGDPGSNKTAIASHFLLADYLRYLGEHEIDKTEKWEEIKDDVRKLPRSVVYSFGSVRRTVIDEMRKFVTRRNEKILREELLTSIDGDKYPRVFIRNLSPGYLFPETFIEDLLDTVQEAERDGDPVKRIVFDSFDRIQTNFPIMRANQFFWKVVGQVCRDHCVSGLVKMTPLTYVSDYYRDMAGLLSNLADNVVQCEANRVSVVSTELGAQSRNSLQVQRVDLDGGVWLRLVK